MPTDVQMPQMGESIYEGTITKWLKQPGDKISADEPLYELSTDKVDTEIPSPISGTLVEIKVQEGEKVPIHTVVAVVDESGTTTVVKAEAPKPKEEKPPEPAPAPKPEPAPAPAPVAEPVAQDDNGEKQFASPLVRRIAREEGVDLSQIKGSGWKGRITKQDIMEFLEQSRRGGAPAPVAAPKTAPTAAPAVAPKPKPAAPVYQEGENVDIVPMTPMRTKIAEHMIDSRRTSAHVTTVFEADMSKIVAIREREKDDFQRVYGTKLTYTPFYAMAAINAIKQFPILNSSLQGNKIVYKHDINMGFAVALPDGLIVPVVHHSEEKSFLGMCRAINDVATRSRNKKLQVHEVSGGTFTITNPGVYGGMFGTPIINQPQVAIMGIGGIEKRPVVIDDAIAIRSMCYIVLSFDHRVIDGATADMFMAVVKDNLQNWKIPIK